MNYYRVIQSRTKLAGSTVHDVYATSPPSSSFIMGDTMVVADSKDNSYTASQGKQYSMCMLSWNIT